MGDGSECFDLQTENAMAVPPGRILHTVVAAGDAVQGVQAREVQVAGSPNKFVGLLLVDRGVLRSHQRVIVAGLGAGEVTSGTFSPVKPPQKFSLAGT